MLVLSRKFDEAICIGDDIEVVVVAVQGDKVRLGIIAPKDVIIHRKEIWLKLQQLRGELATSSPSTSPAA